MIEKLEAMLAAGQDNPLLRLSLGTAYLNKENIEKAVQHLQQAVHQDPEYSAAWKVYGKALFKLGNMELARYAYETGISVANKKGDVQAVKEMNVFLKRVLKAQQAEE